MFLATLANNSVPALQGKVRMLSLRAVEAAGGLEGERSSGGDLRVAPERVAGGGEAFSAADRGGGGDRAPAGARGGAGGVRGACGEGGGGAGRDDWVHVEEDRGGGIGWEGALREEESGVVSEGGGGGGIGGVH